VKADTHRVLKGFHVWILEVLVTQGHQGVKGLKVGQTVAVIAHGYDFTALLEVYPRGTTALRVLKEFGENRAEGAVKGALDRLAQGMGIHHAGHAWSFLQRRKGCC
jgi:hypothetical protein